MKKINKILLVTLGVAIIGFLFFGNTNKDQDGTTLRFVHDKGTWDFSRVLALMTNKYGMNFADAGVFNETVSYSIALQTSLNSDKATYDFMSWWSGIRLIEAVEANWALDLTDIWDDAIARGEYTEDQKNMFSVDGKAYGVPLHMSTWAMYYNRETFRKLNLSPPKTWNEFLTLIDDLKAAGKTPIMSRGNGWESFIWFAELLARTGANNYNDLMEGKISYTSEPVQQVFKVWRDLYERKAFSIPTLNQADLNGFTTGEFTMSMAGDWGVSVEGIVSEEHWGVFPLPPFNDNDERVLIYEVAPIIFARNSLYTNELLQIAETWLSIESMNFIAEDISLAGGNLKAKTPHALFDDMNNYIKKYNPTVVLRYWEATPSGIAQEAVDEFYRFMLNPTEETAELVMQNLDRISQEFWDK